MQNFYSLTIFNPCGNFKNTARFFSARKTTKPTDLTYIIREIYVKITRRGEYANDKYVPWN